MKSPSWSFALAAGSATPALPVLSQHNVLLRERITKMSSFKTHNEPAKPSTQGTGTGRQPRTNRKDRNPFSCDLETCNCTTLSLWESNAWASSALTRDSWESGISQTFAGASGHLAHCRGREEISQGREGDKAGVGRKINWGGARGVSWLELIAATLPRELTCCLASQLPSRRVSLCSSWAERGGGYALVDRPGSYLHTQTQSHLPPRVHQEVAEVQLM